MVDADGRTATYTGAKADPWCGGRCGPDYAVAGNLLVSEDTVAAMEAAFLASGEERDLADRLIAVLEAGQAAGGDRRGRQSAAVIVVHRTVVPFVDLRVDDHPDPVAELRRLYDGRSRRRTTERRCASVTRSPPTRRRPRTRRSTPPDGR